MSERIADARAMTNGADDGTTSSVEQFGPLEPMKEVFPTSVFPCMVKFRAEVIAMPYPNAPDSVLSRTVPDALTLLPKKSPNHVRGPIAMPILHNS